MIKKGCDVGLKWPKMKMVRIPDPSPKLELISTTETIWQQTLALRSLPSLLTAVCSLHPNP